MPNRILAAGADGHIGRPSIDPELIIRMLMVASRSTAMAENMLIPTEVVKQSLRTACSHHRSAPSGGPPLD